MINPRPLLAMAALAGLCVAAPALAQGSGAATFKSFCGACHNVDRPPHNGIGPSLAGIMGRKAGTLPGYNFSKPMKAYGQAWTAANMDAFLLAPSQLIPGTKMTLFGVKDPAKRAGLIAYLKAQK
jgi:cytochrome c